MTDALESALNYAAHGLPVIPVKPRSKVPDLRSWPDAATTDPDILTAWFTADPDRGVGIATGHPHAGGYLTILDIDEHDPAASGTEALRDLEAELGPLPDTYTVLTPTGGRHIYLRASQPLTNAAGSNLPAGIDVRGAGGYVLAPPSEHPNGGTYDADVDYAIDELAALPAAWEARLAHNPTRQHTQPAQRPTSPTWANAPRPTNDRPGDAWANTVTWADLLTADGWQHDGPSGDGGEAYIRPGKTRREGPGATVNYKGSDLLKIFTTSAHPLKAEQTYSKLGYLTETKFAGDYNAAVDHLRTLGYGAPPSTSSSPPAEVNHVAADPSDKWEHPAEVDEYDRPPFPLHVLPEWMAAQARQAADEMQLTADLAAQLGITALSVVTAGRVSVRVRGPWHEWTNTYLVTALPPSAGKSPTFGMMLRPLDIWEKELAEDGQKAAEDRDLDRKHLEKLRDDAVKKGEISAAKMHADDLRAIPVLHPPRLLADDATPEKLVDLLDRHNGRLALVSTEGGLFGMMTGRYSEKANLDVYLGAWSGDTIRVDRIERGSTVVHEPRLTVGLTVQPDVISRLGKERELVGRGLTARFMYSIPADTVGRRNKRRAVTYDDAVEARYERSLLGIARHLADRTSDDPQRLELTPEALDAFLTWQDGREARIGPYGPDRHMAEWVAKCDSTVLRLAGLLHVADGNLDGHIVEHTMARALTVGDYWTAHARAAFDIMGASDDLGHARWLLGWLRNRTDKASEVTFREMAQAGKKRVDSSVDLYPAVDLLVEHGWLAATFDGTLATNAGKGRGASPTFLVHPSLVQASQTLTPLTPTETGPNTAQVREVRVVSPRDPLEHIYSLNERKDKETPEPGLTSLTSSPAPLETTRPTPTPCPF